MMNTKQKVTAGGRTQSDWAIIDNIPIDGRPLNDEERAALDREAKRESAVDAMQHTPGPWYENTKPNAAQGLIYDATGKNLAVSYDPKDAALIAAAPELLDACKWLLNRATLEGTQWSEMDDAQAAITKAQGAVCDRCGTARPIKIVMNEARCAECLALDDADAQR